MINYLKTIVSLPNEDFLAMQQLQDSLLFNQPKLTLASAAKHYDDLQIIAKRLGKRIRLNAEQLQPNKAVFFSGIWTTCPSSHIYCKPRGLLVSEEGKWLCPECTK